MFFLVPVTLWLSAHVFLGLRLVRPSPLRGVARAAAWSALGLGAMLPLLNLVLLQAGVRWAPLAWAGFVLLGVFSTLFALMLAVELLRWPARRWVRVDAGRRRFMGNVVNASVVGATASLGAAGVAQARATADVVPVDVPCVGLPPSLEGLRIVQLSDVHVGPTIRGEDLQVMVDRVNDLHADLVVITGDLVDGFVEDLREEVEPLRHLRARHGVYYVTGNHEYYWDGLAWCRHVASLGVHVLCNEHVCIEHDGGRILLAGATDLRAAEFVPEHRSDPRKAMSGAPPHDVSILLAHQPRSIDEASAAGFDLQISGHTHGGQYVPFNAFVHLAQPYVAGLHRHDKTWIYVSRGTGYWGPPMRSGAPQEITLLRLRGA